MAPQFHAIQYGVDDLTLGFDMEGSPSVRDLDASPGLQARRGKMLGERTSWGRWAHLLGRSVSFWKSDTKRLYANLVSRVTRLAREVQAMELAERMRRGEVSHGQAERLHLFLDLERLGVAGQCYRKSVYTALRREAAKLGYSANESASAALDVDLADLLAAYVRAVDGD